jgi:hypothetical protein
LSISEKKLASELEKLESLRLISKKKNQVCVESLNIHLDEDHPISPVNHVNWRLESINHINKRERHPSDYHLSVAFAADNACKVRLKEMFKDFIVSAQKEVATSPGGDVHYMIFDLFS